MTDDNSLYYMRQRYYNPQIKRFINQDILTGSIGNSASLNRYSYVEGNPVSYTDPFGLSPYQMISLGIHTGLDVWGIWNPAADFVNSILYFLEGKPGEGAKSLILMIPGSDFLGKGTKLAAKFGKHQRKAEIIVKGINAAGHIGSAGIMAYETGTLAGMLIDKYLVNEAELSSQTVVEVGILVLGGYGTYKYTDMLNKYAGNLLSPVKSATPSVSGASTKTVVVVTDGVASGHLKMDLQLFASKNNNSLNRIDVVNTKKQTPDQKALRDLAKEAEKSAKKGHPISEEEARILDEWADEYNVPQHHKAYSGSGAHFKGGNYSDHTHIYNIHVPYKSGGN